MLLLRVSTTRLYFKKLPGDRFIVKLGVATLKYLFNCSTAIVFQDCQRFAQCLNSVYFISIVTVLLHIISVIVAIMVMIAVEFIFMCI